MATSDYLINIETRRQVMLERYKSGQVAAIMPLLSSVAKDIRNRLLTQDLTELSRARQNRLLADVAELAQAGFERITAEARQGMLSLAVDEAAFEAKALERAIVGFESVVPAPAQIQAAALAAPMSVRGTAGTGKLLDPWLKGWTAAQVEAIEGTIRLGFYQGATNQDMIRNVVGTLSRQYQDGDFQRIQRSAQALVRTGVQHTAMVARTETLKENGVKRYKWLSTLDFRTSSQCQSLDGMEFDMGEGPLPPIHPGCRSSITSVLPDDFDFLREGATRASRDGYVDADETYFSWLKKQNPEFQDEAMGPTWAKLFRDGGLSADEFAKQRIGKDFAPITLDEMREKLPAIFERAGV